MKRRAISAFLLSGACLLASGDALLEGLGLDSEVAREETRYTCLPLPPAEPPAQHSSAEGLPPLPLPVVPLRRTEKKNPPRPPVLIAKLATGDKADWATNPGDAANLLKWMARNLNVHFSDVVLPADRIPADPRDIPLLYRTGHDAFSFTPEIRRRIRAYLLRGGTLVLDACCGRAAFARSALKEMRALIPERPPYFLDAHHPLFHSYFDVRSIGYRPYALKAGARNGDPAVIGIDVGCRTAVFFFRWDVSCGWDDQPDTDRHHCLGYDIPTAKRLGANLMAYITAERSAALPLSQALEFVDAARGRAGKFEIACVQYNGLWKTREAGLSMLLDSFHEQTRTPVRFAKEQVRLDSRRLFELPLVYLTGHQDFVLTPSERAGLRSYLMRGGVLVAEACCGRAGFDQAFRRELALAMPGLALEKLPPGHPIFHYPNLISGVHPRPALARALKTTRELVPPELLALKHSGHVAVVYSPRGLACGWELAECPYCQGLQSKDAMALGVNILAYCIMQ